MPRGRKKKEKNVYQENTEKIVTREEIITGAKNEKIEI